MSQTKKGIYYIRNRHKYKGVIEPLIYRSSWEHKFMIYCDNSVSIWKWSYERIRVPYMFNGKSKSYLPDFWIRRKDGEFLIEIKPIKQTKPPKSKSKIESHQYKINRSKWQAAKSFCEKYNMNFMILTENTISRLNA